MNNPLQTTNKCTSCQRLRFWWLPLLLWLILLGSRVGPFMHESDQASLLDGAWQLAFADASILNPDFYEYGKFFGSYWILAAALRWIPGDPVMIGNLVSFLFFSVGICLFGRAVSGDRQLIFYVVPACLVAPAVLLHAPYAAPNFLSLGFLFAGVAAALSRFRWKVLVAVFCWVLAATCRMDALLLWPLLVWSFAPEASLRGLATSKRAWVLMIVAVSVFCAGHFLSGGEGGVGYAPFFYPKVFVAYLLFGLGGSLLLFCGGLFLVGAKARRSVSLDERLFWIAGAVALVAPFLFYCAFLFSPRHWTVCIGGLMIFSVSRHTRRAVALRPILGQRVCGVALACSLLLLVVGLRLPQPSRPSLSVMRPTLFPTSDGRAPMGALIPFLFSDARLDHNQAVWAAACAVPKFDEVNGKVSVLESPLKTIVSFAVRLTGQEPEVRSLAAVCESNGYGYLPCRTLLKTSVAMAGRPATSLPVPELPLTLVGGAFPTGLLRIGSGRVDDGALRSQIGVSRDFFQGDDFFWAEGPLTAQWFRSLKGTGRRICLVSESPFSVNGVPAMGRAVSSGGELIIYEVKSGAEAVSHISAEVSGAASVYPEYMRVQRF